MSPVLRIVLIIGSIYALSVVVRRVKRRKIRIADSVFWVCCAVLLTLIALFPQIAFFFSGLLGVLSPSNFVFCAIIALMLVKLFNLSCDVSRLTDKTEQLAHEIAVLEKTDEDEKDAED